MGVEEKTPVIPIFYINLYAPHLACGGPDG